MGHLRQIISNQDDKAGNQVQEVQSMYEPAKWRGLSTDEEQEHVVICPLHRSAAGARKSWRSRKNTTAVACAN